MSPCFDTKIVAVIAASDKSIGRLHHSAIFEDLSQTATSAASDDDSPKLDSHTPTREDGTMIAKVGTSVFRVSLPYLSDRNCPQTAIGEDGWNILPGVDNGLSNKMKARDFISPHSRHAHDDAVAGVACSADKRT
jgi:hypothetical protein